MDYGQSSQLPGNKQPFFTAGAGSISPNLNNFESENNLDLTNESTWEQPESEHDYRGIGNSAINPFDNELQGNSNQENTDLEAQGKAAQIAEIDPLMPPSSEPLEANSFHRPIHPSMDGEHLSRTTLNEVHQAVAKLNQTGDAAGFYDTIRGAVV